jgi:uncharacterized membrane protein (UPF0127 family)
MVIKKNDEIIAKKVKFANNIILRAKGLMFEKESNFNYSLIFEFPKESKIGCSLHMLFVFFPIDVIFLNSEKKVVDLATLKPWSLGYTPKRASKYVIETQVGTNKKIKINDTLSW